MQPPATAEIEKCIWIWVRFSTNFDSGSGSERKAQNLSLVDSGTLDPWLPLPQTHGLCHRGRLHE